MIGSAVMAYPKIEAHAEEQLKSRKKDKARVERVDLR
jgi:hypothetical protein